MAIKGKGRARQRQPVRAPRRGPVPVPVPFARRRSVQVVAAFVAGLLLFWGGIWLTNGLREQRATEGQREEELQRRQAGSAWNNLVESEVGTIGSTQEGRPPTILPQVRETITELRTDGPPNATERLEEAATAAEEASAAIREFGLSQTLRDKGFDEAGVLRFLSARDELVTAIELYREAALTGVLAAELEGQDRGATLDRAESLLAMADAEILRYYEDHTEAMASAGIIQQPTLPGG
jgi:hypothetical protein